MDRNSIIGMILLIGVMLAWTWYQQPSPEELERQQAARDSVALVEQQKADQPQPDSAQKTQPQSPPSEALPDLSTAEGSDSLLQQKLTAQYGVFAPASRGTEKEFVLENDLIKLTFSSKGGWIKEAILKEYMVITGETEDGKEMKEPLKMMNDVKNHFGYELPIGNLKLSSADLFYDIVPQSDNAVSFRATTSDGRTLEHFYKLLPDSYHVDYELRTKNLKPLLGNTDHLNLHWVNYLNYLEKNVDYERSYSTVYFKPADNGVDYCSCRSNDSEELDKPIKWFSHANQFFNTSLVAETAFGPGIMETFMLEEGDDDLKKLESHVNVPLEGENFAIQMYVGPNEYDELREYGVDLESIIPYGWSLFGTVNRWVVRPLFNFLTGFISSAGLAILVLTVIVKLLVYPLTYKMLYSQSKMAALKPYLAKAKEKHKDDQQKQQMETMKAYQEFGVNPLGGCFPIFLQMPIWFALYRFFPASIEFRQASFLWATDLSSYDEFIKLGTELPFYGDHVSLFTLIWVITTLIYTYYNTKYMDMSANPMAKYMQYLMPVFFLFFFNNFASGLTAYLCFSNVFNIAQTLVTKNYFINHDKIKDELEAYRKKPKKKKGFSQRFQNALQEQQRVQEERKKKKK